MMNLEQARGILANYVIDNDDANVCEALNSCIVNESIAAILARFENVDTNVYEALNSYIVNESIAMINTRGLDIGFYWDDEFDYYRPTRALGDFYGTYRKVDNLISYLLKKIVLARVLVFEDTNYLTIVL